VPLPRPVYAVVRLLPPTPSIAVAPTDSSACRASACRSRCSANSRRSSGSQRSIRHPLGERVEVIEAWSHHRLLNAVQRAAGATRRPAQSSQVPLPGRVETPDARNAHRSPIRTQDMGVVLAKYPKK